MYILFKRGADYHTRLSFKKRIFTQQKQQKSIAGWYSKRFPLLLLHTFDSELEFFYYFNYISVNFLVKWKAVNWACFYPYRYMGVGLYLSHTFFLGPPVSCFHTSAGAIDARYSQKRKLRGTSLLVLTAWFWEEATLQFSLLTHAHSFPTYL